MSIYNKHFSKGYHFLRVIPLTFLLLVMLLPAARATDWLPLLNVELVQKAELVIQGEIVRKDSNLFHVKVETVLKGEAEKEIRLLKPNTWFFSIYLKVNQTGIFFLRRSPNNDAYSVFHPYCLKDDKQRDEIDRAFDIWDHPEKYVEDFETENEEVNYVLGQYLSGWRASSEEVPIFKEVLVNNMLEIYTIANWKDNNIYTIRAEYIDDGKVTIESDISNVRLKNVYEGKIRSFLIKTRHKKHPKKVTITIDNLRKDHSKIPYEQASNYLRDKLKSKHKQIVISAIQALSLMGDAKCVPELMLLVNAPDLEVSKLAVRALGWSKSNLCIDLIGSILLEKSENKKEEYKILGAASEALRNINQKECIPYLEYASKYGVYRAIYALGTMGDEHAIEIFISSLKNNPDQCYNAVNALRILVERSNYPLEDWMKFTGAFTVNDMKAKIPLWLNWYENIGDDFKIVMSWQDALRKREEKR